MYIYFTQLIAHYKLNETFMNIEQYRSHTYLDAIMKIKYQHIYI